MTRLHTVHIDDTIEHCEHKWHGWTLGPQMTRLNTVNIDDTVEHQKVEDELQYFSH